MNLLGLEDDHRVLVLAPGWGRWQDELVEVTTTPEDTMSMRTCATCGDTGAVGQLFYESNPTHCKPCTVKKINEHIHRINEATRDTAENHRQPWTELEVEMLLSAVAEGMHAKDIAEMLGRTYLAVHGKIRAIRMLADQGQPVTYRSFESTTTTTTTKITVRRDPNHVGSAPDEDRWWEADYYTKGNQS